MRIAGRSLLLISLLALADCGHKLPPDTRVFDDSDWYRDPNDPRDKPRPVPAVAPEICGEIRLSAEVGSMKPSSGWEAWWVFVFARKSPGGAAIAGMKMKAGAFPMRFCLGLKNSVVPGTTFAGDLWMSAQLDGDGAPELDPGDFDGSSRTAVPLGTRNAIITIDTFR